MKLRAKKRKVRKIKALPKDTYKKMDEVNKNSEKIFLHSKNELINQIIKKHYNFDCKMSNLEFFKNGIIATIKEYESQSVLNMSKKEVYRINQNLRKENKEFKRKIEECLAICKNIKLKPIDKITPIHNILSD